jgi:hypothetical protein
VVDSSIVTQDLRSCGGLFTSTNPVITPPKRNIDFSINLMPEAAPISKTPYKTSTPESKELQIQLEELLKKG